MLIKETKVNFRYHLLAETGFLLDIGLLQGCPTTAASKESTDEPAQPRRFYPVTEYRPAVTIFVLSQ